LKKHLQEYLSVRKAKGYKTPLLFSSHSADIGLTSHGLKHWVARITKLSGVRFHVHRFRHTFATNLAMQDVGIIKIQKLMGHADIKMTQTYLRSVSTEDMREDVNKLSFENLA
jgi:integrase